MTSNRALPRLKDYWGKSSLFPIGTQYMRGKRYQVCDIDADIHNFLRDLSRYLRETNFHPGRLISLRNDFRQIYKRNFWPIGLVFSLSSQDYLQRRLAAWLLGRCTWPRGVPYLRKCSHPALLELQFEVARALRRLRSWSELRQLELQTAHHHEKKSTTDSYSWPVTKLADPIWFDRLRMMCQPPIAREHSIRLSNFLSGLNASSSASNEQEPTSQTLWYQEPIGPGQQPKSRWFIRRILDRIRLTVRG